ncbi:MAG TPA: hypothetical protein VGM30_24005 [Puia sp.]|jgi:hypothetical protein
MQKNMFWSRILAHAIVAALLYSLAVFFFLRDSAYSESWLLYLGNALFMAVIAVFLILFNNQRGKNASSMAMLKASTLTTAMGAALSVLLCFLLLSLMIPGLFHTGQPQKVLTGEPASTIQDKTHGLLFMIAASATLGNIATGMFVSIIFPFTLKGDQTREKASPDKTGLS